MKNRLWIAFLAFWTTMTFFGQEKFSTTFEVQYNLIFHPDTLRPDRTSEELFYLYTGREYGIFMNFNEANQELIREDMERQLRANPSHYENKISRHTDFNMSMYKNLHTGEVRTVWSFIYRDYLFDEPAKPTPWEIVDETQELNGYLAQKATTHFAGRDYIAWFTTEIPIPDGPYLFSGLPGLIIELYDTRDHYHFTMVGIQKLEEPKVWELTKDEITTKADFFKLKAKEPEIKARDMFTIKGQESKKIVIVGDREVTEAEYRRMLEKAKAAKNNPIELE